MTNDEKMKAPPEMKREAVKALRELIVAIENDEINGMVWVATQPGMRTMMGIMLHSYTPTMLGSLGMLRSGLEHGLMQHLHVPEESPTAHLRVVAGAKVTPIKRATKKRVQKKTPRKK